MQESINFISMTEPKTRVYVTSEISDKPILMQVDTGVSCNVIPDKYLPPGTLINETERTLTCTANAPWQLLALSN